MFENIDWQRLRDYRESLIWAYEELMNTPGGHQLHCDRLINMAMEIDRFQEKAIKAGIPEDVVLGTDIEENEDD